MPVKSSGGVIIITLSAGADFVCVDASRVYASASVVNCHQETATNCCYLQAHSVVNGYSKCGCIPSPYAVIGRKS